MSHLPTQTEPAEPPASEAGAVDAVAWAQLFQLHSARIKLYIEQHMPRQYCSQLDAADLLQDVFVDAMMQVGCFVLDGPDAPLRCFLTLARERIVTFVRRMRALKRGGNREQLELAGQSSLLDHLSYLATNATSPGSGAAARELAAIVLGCLNLLEPDAQRVLRLRYIDGLSVAECADRMDRSERAVISLTQRAVKLLREQVRTKVGA